MRMPMREAGAMTTFNRLFRRATLGDAAELAELGEVARQGAAAPGLGGMAIGGQGAPDATKRAHSFFGTDTNTVARLLYDRNGFREATRRRMVKQEWRHPGSEWVLMTKWAADHAG